MNQNEISRLLLERYEVAQDPFGRCFLNIHFQIQRLRAGALR